MEFSKVEIRLAGVASIGLSVFSNVNLSLLSDSLGSGIIREVPHFLLNPRFMLYSSLKYITFISTEFMFLSNKNIFLAKQKHSQGYESVFPLELLRGLKDSSQSLQYK